MADVAGLILGDFHSYMARFNAITARAKSHFERADWSTAHEDAVVRLNLYGQLNRETIDVLGGVLRQRMDQREGWQRYRADYRGVA